MPSGFIRLSWSYFHYSIQITENHGSESIKKNSLLLNHEIQVYKTNFNINLYSNE